MLCRVSDRSLVRGPGQGTVCLRPACMRQAGRDRKTVSKMPDVSNQPLDGVDPPPDPPRGRLSEEDHWPADWFPPMPEHATERLSELLHRYRVSEARVPGTARAYLNRDHDPDSPYAFDAQILGVDTESMMSALDNIDPVTGEEELAQDVPTPELAPEYQVWIMPTPNRRGPGRAQPITRYPAWQGVWADVVARGWDALDGLPTTVDGFRAPRQSTGSNYTVDWWYLGWHEGTGHPMFAVRPRGSARHGFGEAEARTEIRGLITGRVIRGQCTRCWSEYPVAVSWPPREGHVAQANLVNYGHTNLCSSCATGMITCERTGCNVIGAPAELAQVVTTMDGTVSRLCAEHRTRSAVQCPHCQLFFASRMIMEPHNCMGVTTPWGECRLCHRISRRYDLREFADGMYPVCTGIDRRCSRNVRLCTVCGFYGLNMVDYDLGTACDNCQREHDIDQCEHCSRWFAAEEDHDCWSSGRCMCNQCRYGGRYNPIRSYSYKPRPRFKGNDKHGLFLGMELEIFMDRSRDVTDVARSTQEILGKVAYLKSDSSISHGFEMVTHPMSYEYAMSEFPWRVLDHLEGLGSFATDGSGIHIHASRAGFAGAAHEYRWMIFLHRNAQMCQIMAQRVSEQWASFGGDQRKIAKDIATKKVSDTRRYRAINQTNEHTIEVRIFKSSTDEQSVKSTIGLVHASIEYTRKIRSADVIKDAAWTWSAFAKWVASVPAYAPLWAEMQRLGCTEDNAPTATPFVASNDCGGDCAGGFECDGCRCDECSPCRERAACDCGGSDRCRGECGCWDCDGCCMAPEDEDETW
jgi:hypothetical protein